LAIVNKAAKEKVWNTLPEDKTYRICTEEFSRGPHYINN